jgi:hypothetical protein
MTVTVTSASLLGADHSPAALARMLSRSPADQRVQDKLPPRYRPLKKFVVDLIAEKLHELLGEGPADFLLGCYGKVDQLREAAQESLAEPGANKHVVLLHHRITSSHPVDLAVAVDGLDVARIECVLTVTFQVPELLATLREGRLVGAELGEATMTVTISVEGAELPPFERSLPAETRVDITPGILLASRRAALAQDAGVPE